MNKLFSRFLKCSLLVSLVASVGGQIPVQASELDETEEISLEATKISIENEQLNYNGIIETLYADGDAGISSYKISEFGEEYTLIIDVVEDKFILNDVVLTGDQYSQLIEEQVKTLESQKKTRSVNSGKGLLSLSEKYNNQKDSNIQTVYDFKHQVYIDESLTHEEDHSIGNPLLRCLFCPLKTVQIPTSNYQSKYYYCGIFDRGMTIALTAGAISAVAAFATFGASEVARTMIQSALAVAGGVASVSGSVKYEKYIAYHNVCPRANKEKRVSYIQVKGNKSVAKTTYNCFYAAKPW